MKIRLFILLALLVVVTAAFVITTFSGNEIKVEKFVGSKQGMSFSMMSYQHFSDLVLNTDTIVIGTVESVADVQEHYWYEPDPDNPEEGDEFGSSTYFETYYNIIVDETLFGDKVESFLLCLYGIPDSDFGMTKPKIGDNVVLLVGDNDRGSYAVTGMENGIFIINKDNTVYSLSDEEVTAQFDGKSLNTLKKEISKAQKSEYSKEFLSIFEEKYQEEYRERARQRNNS